MMSNLTKDQIQNIWDAELISEWSEWGGRMGVVLNKFLLRVEPSMQTKNAGGRYDISFQEVSDYMVSLGLKRCLDIGTEGELCFRAARSDVIGFIQARCHKMSLDLMSGELKPVVLINIEEYKWTKRNYRSKAASEIYTRRHREKLKQQGTSFIKARKLSKKHDWTTVK